MWLEIHRVEHEGPFVGLLVEDFAGRLARAVASVGLDADQDRVGTGMGGLQAGGKLEAVCRDHAVVVVGRGDHCGGVVRAVFEVVERGVAVEVVEVDLGAVRAAVFRNPAPADRELVVAEHVHHAHRREGHARQLRTLCHGGAHKESAVGAAGDGQAVIGRVSFCDQVFACGDEVVEYVLLLQQHAALVPILTELAAAAQVGHGVDAALFEQDDVGGREARGQGDVEPAVSIQHRWALAVHLKALLVDDEHGDHGAVFGGVEHLLAFVSGRVEVDVGHIERGALACGHVIAENGSGIGE